MPLFDLQTKRPDKFFERLRTSRHGDVARKAMLDVFASFSDPDGNFVEQFQSNGFSARVLELYLHAALSELRYRVGRPSSPDFIIERDGERIVIEATTTNPSTSGVLATNGRALSELTPEERWDYLQNEWAVRIGGPLTGKLNKRYWQKSVCAGLPFVIVLEAFHDPAALALTHSMVSSYLYGHQIVSPRLVNGRMVAEHTPLEHHVVGSKKIPSGFFFLPEAENISAVIFTNAATTGKFTRMGWSNHGSGPSVARTGSLWNPHPEIRHATWFAYTLENPLFQERWTDGMVVMHNPRARHPLPDDSFGGTTQVRGPGIEALIQEHVFSSSTIHNEWPVVGFEPLQILGIPQDEGRALAGIPLPDIVTADYWFATADRQLVGVVTQDTEEPTEWRAWHLASGKHGLHYPFDDCSRLFSFDQAAVDFLQEGLAFRAFRAKYGEDGNTWVPSVFPRTFNEMAARRAASNQPSTGQFDVPRAPN